MEVHDSPDGRPSPHERPPPGPVCLGRVMSSRIRPGRALRWGWMAIELWRVVSEAPNYSVSSHGRFRRDVGPQCRTERILSTRRRDKDGYTLVRWCTGRGKCSQRRLHCLVARAFLGPCPDGLEVDHIDGDKTNARLSNLRYVTPKMNVRAAMERRNGMWGGVLTKRKTPASTLVRLYRLVKVGGAVETVARQLGVSSGVAWSVVAGYGHKYLGLPPIRGQRARRLA